MQCPTVLRPYGMLPNVKGVTAIGCVLAVEVHGGAGGEGYSSGAAKDIVLKLRASHGIQARPLGNVLYLMCAPTTAGRAGAATSSAACFYTPSVLEVK